jgi:hypothetical protein
MYIDMKALPRPIKMLNQTVNFTNTPGTQNLEFPNSSITAVSTLNLQMSFSSLTPQICQVTPAGNTANIKALSSGTCQIEAWAEGNSTTNPSPRIQYSFQINPIVMKSQYVNFLTPYDVTEGDSDFELNISTSSNLPLTVKSLSQSSCFFKDPINHPLRISILSSGVCEILISQNGNSKYLPISDRRSFAINTKLIPTPTVTRSVPATTIPKPKVKSPATSKPVKTILCIPAGQKKAQQYTATTCPPGTSKQ